jgi:hypothetical protein
MIQDTASSMQPSSAQKIATPAPTHRLRIFIVIVLIILTIQGWFGDTVNIFVAPPGTNTAVPLSNLFSTISNYGIALIWHAYEGFLLLALSFVLIGASFAWSKKRSVRIMSILGALMIVSAVIGGVSFILSGFNSGAATAQMGGSFIGAYAFYFMELYFTKS